MNEVEYLMFFVGFLAGASVMRYLCLNKSARENKFRDAWVGI